jgi:hypothetical protein
MEECASTTNPQVGIKYERSIYVTSGRCLSGNFLQHSNTDKLSVSSKSCLYICENHCSTCWGQYPWPLNIDQGILKSLAQRFYRTTHTHQPKRSHYVWRLHLFSSCGAIPLLRGSLFWGLHWSHVQTHITHDISPLADISCHRYFFLHKGNRSTQSWISLTPGGP